MVAPRPATLAAIALIAMLALVVWLGIVGVIVDLGLLALAFVGSAVVDIARMERADRKLDERIRMQREAQNQREVRP